jgi:hypothetical protein
MMIAATIERVGLRMRDVALALLAAQERSASTLNRIGLQKFIYLMDSVSILYDSFPPRDGHVTYHHGPYDPAIQNAVDSLAFRGITHVVSLREHSDQLSTAYTLTDAGTAWAKQLSAYPLLERRWKIASDIASHAAMLGWPRLRALVYAEPTYASVRSTGLGKQLAVASQTEPSTVTLLSHCRAALSPRPDDPPPTRALLLDILFRYLDTFARRATLTTKEGADASA